MYTYLKSVYLPDISSLPHYVTVVVLACTYLHIQKLPTYIYLLVLLLQHISTILPGNVRSLLFFPSFQSSSILHCRRLLPAVCCLLCVPGTGWLSTSPSSIILGTCKKLPAQSFSESFDYLHPIPSSPTTIALTVLVFAPNRQVYQ